LLEEKNKKKELTEILLDDMSIALEILESEIVNNHSKINIIDKEKISC